MLLALALSFPRSLPRSRSATALHLLLRPLYRARAPHLPRSPPPPLSPSGYSHRLTAFTDGSPPPASLLGSLRPLSLPISPFKNRFLLLPQTPRSAPISPSHLRDLPDKHEAMPPRRKRGRAPSAAKQPPPPPEPPGADAPLQEQFRWLADQELERRKAAIRAIQAAETESVLSRLRLVRSYISKEQEETCALQFFQENLPNVSVLWNEKQDELELKWKDWDDHIIGDQRDDKISRASIASLPTAAGFQFSGDSVQKNFIEITGFDFNNFTWSDLPKGQMTGAADALQTPGAMSSRLSFGMTPKTVRLPKNGEMLLSMHGSPLGVYKEENLAAIKESGNGSDGAAS